MTDWVAEWNAWRDAMPHYVYRYFDGDVLLYIGCTYSPSKRDREHRGENWWKWYRFATRVEFTEYPNAQEGYAAEARAIWTEGSVHNVNGAPVWSAA